MDKLRILELFGGIGACSKALEKLNIDYEIADYVEIDKYAVKSFNAIHNTNFEPQDICNWNKNIDVDLLLGGFPCQDVSLAGLQKGIVKGETRSGLMYEMMRIIKKVKPMGFEDEDFEKASQVNSNTQLYKQAGNSIVVDVLVAILKELF